MRLFVPLILVSVLAIPTSVRAQNATRTDLVGTWVRVSCEVPCEKVDTLVLRPDSSWMEIEVSDSGAVTKNEGGWVEGKSGPKDKDWKPMHWNVQGDSFWLSPMNSPLKIVAFQARRFTVAGPGADTLKITYKRVDGPKP